LHWLRFKLLILEVFSEFLEVSFQVFLEAPHIHAITSRRFTSGVASDVFLGGS